jgi:VIT1/CCC1 family predicted Fe2+/Mn2+ transporter
LDQKPDPGRSEAERRHHESVDPHRPARSLSDVILGAQDGLVNVLGVLLGVAAAGGEARLVVAAGVATTFAESISMAAVAYTSTLASADVYRSEQQREYRHLATVPDLERAEVRDLYARKGFSGDLLDRVVETITRDKDVWVAVMMNEEHGLTAVPTGRPLRAASVVGVSAFLGSLIPVLPFMLLHVRAAECASTLVAALTLFFVGVYKGQTTVGRPVRSGLQMAMIGTLSALAGYLVGAVVGAGWP